MVAYSFKRQFVAPIQAGTKAQTIRAARRRHAREGEEVQLYTGMRTKSCRLIGRAVCKSVSTITLDFPSRKITLNGHVWILQPGALDQFAQEDGFAGWGSMQNFWRQNHETLAVFSGILIRWTELRTTETTQ